MKSLEIVQKFFKMFKVLSKIAMIFCIVISCIWVVGLICALFYTNITTLNKVFMVQNMNTSTLWVYCLCGMMDVMVGVMRGMGYAIMPMLVSLTGACLFRIVWICTIFNHYRTLECLYISYPISWGLTFMVHLFCFFIIYRKLTKKAS